MRPRLTLRTRIVLAFLAFGVILCTLFAVVALTSMADFERILMRELLQVETQNLIARRHAQPDAPLPSSQRIYAYVGGAEARGTLPAGFSALAPGTHVLERGGHGETYVDVRDDGKDRLYFVIDLSDIAQREFFLRWLLVGVILIGTLVSGTLGMLLAGRLIAPVQRLARWVDASLPQQRHQPLRSHFANDELGALALAFDQYQSRLDAFLQREREFTADASHELRSPLSVLQAGLDVMEEDQGVSPPGRRALQRMQRRAAELADLLDALLYLARSENETTDDKASIPLLAVWQQLCVDYVQTRPTAAVEVEGNHAATVHAPQRVATLVFSQLLRRAIEHVDGEPLHIQVQQDRIEFGPWHALSGIQGGDAGQVRSDRQLGLTLIARLCERLSWELRLPERAGEVLVLLFNP